MEVLKKSGLIPLKTLKLDVTGYDNLKAHTLVSVRVEYNSDRSELTVWFTSIESFEKVLSMRNRELLLLISWEQLGSHTDLAELSERNNSNFSRNFNTMSWYDLLEIEKGQRAKLILRVQYYQMNLDIPLVSRRSLLSSGIGT
ncbi:MAG: transcriptional regulator [Nitrospinae bacterium]|nr:transcriptional regulator [Nitrospinota bacterium]